jgi:hypothetical protein
MGYTLLSGADLLTNPEHRAAYHTLPPAFAFRQAKAVYGKADQATMDFLSKCISAGVLHKTRKGWYEKLLSTPAETSEEKGEIQ